MPKSYKLKLVLGGSLASGKNTVVETNNNGSPIGVSFKPVECLVDEEDEYKFIIWDLKDSRRFRFLFPVFCRGACAGLLCFDLSNRESFSDLHRWITLFKAENEEIPIILIGIRANRANKEEEDEINSLIAEEDLIYIEHAPLLSVEENLVVIFKKLIKTLQPSRSLSNFRMTFDKEDEELIRLKNFFVRCPICKKRIHNNLGLKNMYKNISDPEAMRFKEILIRLVNNMEQIRFEYSNRITLGIPCCDCYKKIFD